MEFKQLISDFSTRHGVERVDPEDNTVAFNVDGIPVLIAADEDEVAMISEIGEPPVEGRADFADLLLATNFNEKGAVFGKSQDSGKYVLIRRLPLVDIDGGAFDAALEELVNQAESWRNLLAAFRPAAEEAAGLEPELILPVCWLDGLTDGETLGREILRPLTELLRAGRDRDAASARKPPHTPVHDIY